jgi:hypothetical protein
LYTPRSVCAFCVTLPAALLVLTPAALASTLFTASCAPVNADAPPSASPACSASATGEAEESVNAP